MNDMAVERCCHECQIHKWGIDIGAFNGIMHFRLGLLMVADNFWLVAKNCYERGAMLSTWLAILHALGLSVPLDEVIICSTATDDSPQFHHSVNGIPIKRTPRHEGFRAMGVSISLDGTFGRELDNRVESAWKVCFSVYVHIM